MRFIIKLKALSLSLILVTACAQSKESHNQEAAKIIKSNTTPNTNSSLTSDGKSEGVEVPSLFDESKSLNKLSNLNVCLQEAPAIQVVQNDCGVIPLKQKTDFETALLKDYISQSCFQKSPQDPNCLAIYNDWSDLKNQKAICLAKLRNCSKCDD